MLHQPAGPLPIVSCVETDCVTAISQRKGSERHMQLRVGQKIEASIPCQVRQLGKLSEKTSDKAAGSHQSQVGKEFLEHGGRRQSTNGTTCLAFHPFHGKRGANASPMTSLP